VRAALVAVLAVLAGCPSSTPSKPTTPTGPTGPPIEGQGPTEGKPPTEVPPAPGEPKISIGEVKSPDDVSRTPPPDGTYRIHMIDVGTGLAIFIQGHDFNMLYDGGTGDPAEKPLRVVAYLAAALGESGDSTCVAKGAPAPKQRVKLDHVVLSHPHLDHGSALDLVVHCFDVQHVWDSGRINQAAFYRDFLEAVGKSATARYHTAGDVPNDHTVGVKGAEIKIERWERFSEGDTVRLGESAKFTILHADAKDKPDPNQNSVVLAVQLGPTRLLLMGDAESGPREDPSAPLGDVEEFLVDQHASDIKADILQVGHHGSKTSSRRAFLDVVKPKLALVSSGPKKYATVVLPDAEIIKVLGEIGAQVLRTDEHDASCPLEKRIGGDSGPGGCDSKIIRIDPP